MDLKNALSVCLISLFSATLVVLIARTLDSRAAARLEPQLERIVEELEAIRTSGGIVRSAGEEPAGLGGPVDDGLMVYYFHGERCPTCRAAEENAREALTTHYAEEMAAGEIGWQVLDYLKDPEAKQMAERFGVISTSIVLAEMENGQIGEHERLDHTLALAGDQAAMDEYLQESIDKMRAPAAEPESPPENTPAPDIPLPE